jgi:dihydrofolate reductase
MRHHRRERIAMPKLRVHNFSISLDGYGAGPDQSLEEPLGVGGEGLHEWIFRTRSGREMAQQLGIEDEGRDAGSEGLDDEIFARGFDGIGAWILGRNMFGPVRGGWGDGDWRGWWGEEPPYHCDVFVLTHHERAPIPMAGGTTFHFVTDGIEPALERAFASAGGQDVRLGGGVATVQQYVRAGLVDELHVPIAPVFLGGGERLFDGLAEAFDGYERRLLVGDGSAAHLVLTKPGS